MPLLQHQSRLFSASSAGKQDIYDVVVVGGGMVGSMVAQMLSTNSLTADLRVAVVNKAPLPAEGTGPPTGAPGLRVSTLTPLSMSLARKAGLHSLLSGPEAAPVRHMQVWDYGGNGFVTYDAAAVGREVMAVVVENEALQAALVHQLRGGACSLFSPVSLVSAHFPPYGRQAARSGAELARLQLSDGQELLARLVVGADGVSSQVRQLAGLRTFGTSYGQRAVVATLLAPHATPSEAGTAWQRFLPNGPIALLPVRGGFHNVIWTTTPGHARQLESLSGAGFAAACNEAFQGGSPPSRNPYLPRSAQGFQPPPTLEQALDAPRHASFPLRLQGSGRYVRPRLALVGDAAHVVHPLAGQGVNLGLADAGELVEAVASGVERGQDIGSLGLLEDQYEASRQGANGAMMAAIDGLKRVFQPQSGLLAGLRGLGLDAINASPALKRRIMDVAMGTRA